METENDSKSQITRKTAEDIIKMTDVIAGKRGKIPAIDKAINRMVRIALGVLRGKAYNLDDLYNVLDESTNDLEAFSGQNDANEAMLIIAGLRKSLYATGVVKEPAEQSGQAMQGMKEPAESAEQVIQVRKYDFVSEGPSIPEKSADKRLLTDQMILAEKNMITRQMSSRIKDFLNSLPPPAKSGNPKVLKRYVSQISRLVTVSQSGTDVPVSQVIRLLGDYEVSVDDNYGPLDARFIKKNIHDLLMSFDMEKEEVGDNDGIEDDHSFSLDEAFNVREVKNIDLGDRNLLYSSDSMDGIIRYVSALAEEDIEVMVRGETGTGKELIAKALHHLSSRKDKPFIALNCTSIPHELLESELFGYKRGAFTGAVKDKPGCLSMVKDGTLFLDEIGDMPVSSQSKLLRVIQEKKFRPVGSYNEDEESFSGRLITATNKDLSQEVSHGRFREDLYYRISGFELDVPPLRKRKEDIIPLTLKLVAGLSCGYSLSREAMEKLLAHDFPGNVRELENIVKRALIHKKVRHPHDRIILAGDITVTRKSTTNRANG